MRKVSRAAKRTKIVEDRDEITRETDAKRLLATAKRESESAQSKKIADAAAALLAKKNSDKAAEMAKQRDIHLQTCFAAKHAASMGAVVRGMSEVALKKAITWMGEFKSQGIFTPWAISPA